MNTTIPEFILYIAFAFLILAMVITLVRLLKGPTINDQITAMDLISSIIIGLILVYSVLISNSMYFDIPVILSLVSFIGTIAVSTYISKKNG